MASMTSPEHGAQHEEADGNRQPRGKQRQTQRPHVAEPGAEVTFEQVLMTWHDGAAKVGTPTVPGAVVKAKVLAEARDRKVIVFKFKKRKGFRKSRGHREYYTLVKIESIEPGN